MEIKKYLKTAQIALRGKTNGGIVYIFPNILVKLMYLLPLMFLWRVLAQSGVYTGMAWLAHSIKMAIISLFSGTVIPFKVLPFGLAAFFEYQPFGSLGGAPLSLFAGTAEPERIIPLQIAWNLVLWPIAGVWLANRILMISNGKIAYDGSFNGLRA